ncbi:MAG TPA: hypothetical protein VK428_11350 [Acidimicrobiales bacterium]|nr:hypothetical protein [Acidimicrobiales bacterium]
MTEAGHGDGASGERPTARRRTPRKIRCEGCLDVLQTRTAWDSTSCRCGSLVLSGVPWRPQISWLGHPGTGWSDVTHDEPEPEEGAETAPSRRLRPFGYRPTIS